MIIGIVKTVELFMLIGFALLGLYRFGELAEERYGNMGRNCVIIAFIVFVIIDALLKA